MLLAGYIDVIMSETRTTICPQDLKSVCSSDRSARMLSAQSQTCRALALKVQDVSMMKDRMIGFF
jgi:hypothetical protein